MEPGSRPRPRIDDDTLPPPGFVRLPRRYENYLAGQKYMHHEDFEFIVGLQRTYGIPANGIDKREGEPNFGRAEFFAATSAVRKYALSLRAQLDQNHPGMKLGDKSTVEPYQEHERKRPSSTRIQDLSYLFLHIPRIRSEYNQVHAEKMTIALPPFTNRLSSIDLERDSRKNFFRHVKELMNDSMLEATQTFNITMLEGLAFVMNYQAKGFMLPSILTLDFFAHTGVDTFTKLLEQVVSEAVKKGENVKDKVRAEFLPHRGIAQRLMRVTLKDFATQAQPAISGKTSVEIHRVLDEASFFPGRCPAKEMIESVEDGEIVQRPIDYEYAATIIDHMPSELLIVA